VAQDGALAPGEHGRHQATLVGEDGVPDRVHPGVDSVKATLRQPPLDCAAAETRVAELPNTDHSMLTLRQVSNGPVQGTVPRFPLTVMGNGGGVGHGRHRGVESVTRE
jgi:hypothetical protein